MTTWEPPEDDEDEGEVGPEEVVANGPREHQPDNRHRSEQKVDLNTSLLNIPRCQDKMQKN